LAKGFDVPDILCGIAARPYRKSLSGHIQQLGRVMRPHPGKEFALWLDHSGNFLRFREDTEDVFANGVPELDDGALDAKVRPEPTKEERETFACAQCSYLMGGMAVCPSCGWERPKRQSNVIEIGGELHEIKPGKSKASEVDKLLRDKATAQQMIWGHALERKQGDVVAAEKFALAQWKALYGSWPKHAFRNVEPMPAHPALVRKIQSQIIAWSHRRSA
jgi:DNA repair protein RadD